MLEYPPYANRAPGDVSELRRKLMPKDFARQSIGSGSQQGADEPAQRASATSYPSVKLPIHGGRPSAGGQRLCRSCSIFRTKSRLSLPRTGECNNCSNFKEAQTGVTAFLRDRRTSITRCSRRPRRACRRGSKDHGPRLGGVRGSAWPGGVPYDEFLTPSELGEADAMIAPPASPGTTVGAEK
jgi:hypothetical protein